MKKGQRRKDHKRKNQAAISKPRRRAHQNPSFDRNKTTLLPIDPTAAEYIDFFGLVRDRRGEDKTTLLPIDPTAAADIAFFGMIRMLFPGLGAKILSCFSALEKAKAEKCECEGSCLCHTGLQIAGVPCPPDCKNYGNHFDGCHRCDCGTPKKLQP